VFSQSSGIDSSSTTSSSTGLHKTLSQQRNHCGAAHTTTAHSTSANATATAFSLLLPVCAYVRSDAYVHVSTTQAKLVALLLECAERATGMAQKVIGRKNQASVRQCSSESAQL
jgi:hypothetical protein